MKSLTRSQSEKYTEGEILQTPFNLIFNVEGCIFYGWVTKDGEVGTQVVTACIEKEPGTCNDDCLSCGDREHERLVEEKYGSDIGDILQTAYWELITKSQREAPVGGLGEPSSSGDDE
jgi:hypothetical protein